MKLSSITFLLVLLSISYCYLNNINIVKNVTDDDGDDDVDNDDDDDDNDDDAIKKYKM